MGETVPGGILEVARLLASAGGGHFEAADARSALKSAEREVHATAPRAARLRLARVLESQHLSAISKPLSAREAASAARPDAPLAIFAVSERGGGWGLIHEAARGRARWQAPGSAEVRWADASEIASDLGEEPDAVLEWIAAAPFDAPAGHAEAHDDGHGADHGHHGPTPFRRLLGLIRPDRGDVATVFLFALGVGLFSLATPLIAMAVVNTAVLTGLPQQLFVLCLALLAALAVASLFQTLQSFVVEKLQQRLFARVVADLAYRLPRVELRAYDRQYGPELVNRFFDVLTVQKSAATLLMDGIVVGLQVFIGLLLLGFYHQYLLGFDLFLIGGLIFIVFVLGRNGVPSAIRESIAKYRVASWVEELARSPGAFKLNGGPALALERADALTRDYLRHRRSHYGILLRQLVFSLGLQALANTLLLGIGGWLVVQKQLTLGQLVAAEIVVTLVVASFTKLNKQLESFYDMLAGVDKLGHLMDLPLERQGGAAPEPHTGGADLAVERLSFAYDGHAPALDDVSLRLLPGERVALTGPHGAGKTTLIDLIYGLRVPSGGHVLIDGLDTRDADLGLLRDHVAVVKGLEVFDGTLAENVRMGRPRLGLGDVRWALRSAGLLDDVLRLPQGLNTKLVPGGAPLSAGQADRLMLARAICGRPRLLILDEALDRMNPETRREVSPALLGDEALWTLLVVTHSEEVAALCGRSVRLTRPGA